MPERQHGPSHAGLAQISAGLTGLMFLPLLNALIIGPEWLHWRVADSVATFLTVLLTGGVIAVWLTLMAARGQVWGDLGLAVFFTVAFLLALGGIAKVSWLTGWLARWRGPTAWLILGAISACFSACIASLIRFPGPSPASRLQRLVRVFWPLTPLLFFHLVLAPGPAPKVPLGGHPAPAAHAGNSGARDLILLFDEWSPDYLYGDRRLDLRRWPHLQQLVADASIHAGATLLGGHTITAIPSLLGTNDPHSSSLFDRKVSQGSSVRVWGWYHDYCRRFAATADHCHSVSIYNTRTLNDDFSLLHPWWTNLNLLPAEGPYRWLKAPFAVRFHAMTATAARRWLDTELSDPTADVVYAHLNLPHGPALQPSPNGNAFDMTESAYLSQFDGIDVLLGAVLSHQERPTRIILLSDHNARTLTPAAQHEHVVFMVRPAVTSAPVRQEAKEDASRLLLQLLLR